MKYTCKEPLAPGHVIAAACFGIQAIGVGIYVAYGVFFHPLMSEFGWPRAVIAGASSLAFFIMGLFGIVVGRLNDTFGPRLLMTVTAVFLGLGYVLMSTVDTIWQLYVYYGVIFGIGMSAIDVIALSTIARWFSRKRGMMTGIVKVGTGAGQFTLPLAASVLISSYGWRQAYVVMGSAACVSLIAIAQLLKRDPDQLNRPADRKKTAPKAHTPPPKTDISFSEARGTVQFWTVCLVNFALVFCFMSVLVHIVPHSRDIGLSAPRAASVLSAIGGVSMIGRFIAGLAIDRVGSKTVMIACFSLLIASLAWLQLADNLWMLYVFACVYGVAHGGFFTAISPIVVELFGIGSHGALFGTVFCFGATGGAIGPIVAGYVFDVTGSYSTAFWLISLMGAIGLGMILSLKPICTVGPGV